MRIRISLLIFLLIATPVFAATDFTQDANCQGAWLMDIDEDPLTDSSGNNRTSALKAAGEPNFASASPPAAYSTGYYDFDGTDDFTDLIAYKAVFGAFTTGSIVSWVRATATTNFRPIIGMSHKSTNNSVFHFSIDNNDKFSVLAKNSAGGDVLRAVSTATVAEGSWIHLAYTTGVGENTWYVNGSAVAVTYTTGDATTQAFFGSIFNAANNWFAIGGRQILVANNYFNGDMDEVAIFDRILSEAEINEIIDDGLAGTAVTGNPQVIMISCD